ncbi:hypothetical protein ACFXO2_34355 [Streptomyces sp. NPDC059152]|uniref:hypothetical protein n=1 Tax=Streptomyces sp. NPDC059152 TaxID=3346742 RepID=UPI003697895F
MRGICTFFAVWLLAAPFLLLGLSASDNSAQLAAVTQHDYRFAPVTITKIHHRYQNSSKTGTTYTYVVTVEAPGPGEHSRALQLRGQVTSSSDRWTTGDRLTGGLYAPDAPSLGIILTPRRHLASLLGGSASPGEMVMLALFGALPITLFLMCVRSRGKEEPEPTTPQSVLGDRPVRRLRVCIAGGTAGIRLTAPDPKKTSGVPQSTLSPALRLSSPEGTRDLFDRCLDPQALAANLEGHAGWLYWAPVAEDPSDWCVAALLVLDDDRYVYGLTPPGCVAELPQGEPVDLPLPDARPLRAVGPYALWQSAVHGPGLYGFGLGFLAVCLIVAGVDSDGGPLLSMCFVTTVGGPVVSLLLIQRLRTAYLRRLAQQT